MGYPSSSYILAILILTVRSGIPLITDHSQGTIHAPETHSIKDPVQQDSQLSPKREIALSAVPRYHDQGIGSWN